MTGWIACFGSSVHRRCACAEVRVQLPAPEQAATHHTRPIPHVRSDRGIRSRACSCSRSRRRGRVLQRPLARTRDRIHRKRATPAGTPLCTPCHTSMPVSSGMHALRRGRERLRRRRRRQSDGSKAAARRRLGGGEEAAAAQRLEATQAQRPDGDANDGVRRGQPQPGDSSGGDRDTGSGRKGWRGVAGVEHACACVRLRVELQ